MDLSYIKEHWTKRVNDDRLSCINAWNSSAKDYIYDGSVNFENNSFLKFMRDKVKFTSEMNVLDIGCGAGAYSVAVAPEVRKVVGVDFSPEMLKEAKSAAERNGISNAEFIRRDWYNCDENEFKSQYDIVFAHTTPAISDYNSLMKMMYASRKYCFLCMPARRSNEILDSLRLMLGMKKPNTDESAAFIFDTVWLNGCNPETVYENKTWNSRKTFDDAVTWYLGRLKEEKCLNEKEEESVIRFLSNVSINGYVSETIKTTLVSFFWEFK